MAALPPINQRYRLRQRLAFSELSSVHIAVDERTGDHVAVKLLPANVAPRHLVGEFARLSRLHHPHVAEVRALERVTVGPSEYLGRIVLVTQFIEGRAPTEGAATSDWAEVNLWQVALDVALGLAHIHRAGLLHGDIKPGNIIVDAVGRSTILDLGLSRTYQPNTGASHAELRTRPGSAFGTLGYMSPESFVGLPTPRSDIYSLGATLYHCATGRLPRREIADVMRGKTVEASELESRLGVDFGNLVISMLAYDAGQRPQSAQQVAEAVADAADAARQSLDSSSLPSDYDCELLPPEVIGRDAEADAIKNAIADPTVNALVLRGESGSGRASVFRRAQFLDRIANANRSHAPSEFKEITTDILHREYGSSEQELSVQDWADLVISRVQDRHSLRSQPLALFVHDIDERSNAIIRALMTKQRLHEVLWVFRGADETISSSAGDEDFDESRVVVLEIPALADADIAAIAQSMIGRPAGEDWLTTLFAICLGKPHIAVAGIRAAARHTQDAAHTHIEAVTLADLDWGHGPLSDALQLELNSFPDHERRVAQTLAVLASESAHDVAAKLSGLDPAAFWNACSGLERKNWLQRTEDTVRLLSRRHSRAAYASIAPRARKDLHTGAIEELRRGRHSENRALEIAHHRSIVGDPDEACDAFERLLMYAGASGDYVKLREYEQSILSRGLCHELLKPLTEAYLQTTQYHLAKQYAERLLANSPPDDITTQLVAARAFIKAGDHDGGESVLRQCAATTHDKKQRQRIHGQLALCLIAKGGYREAKQLTQGSARDDSESTGWTDGLEAHGLAEFYLGQRASADAIFRKLHRHATRASNRRAYARAESLLGMVAHANGQIARASQHYEAAATLARQSHDVHSAAVYDLNLACAKLERGSFSSAKATLTGALRLFRRLDNAPQLAAALFNLGVAQLALRDFEAAKRSAKAAQNRAEAQHEPHMALYATLLEGEIAYEQDALQTAISHCRAAEKIAHDACGPRERGLVTMQLALARARMDDRSALKLCQQAHSLISAAPSTPSEHEDDASPETPEPSDELDRLLVVKARVLLALGDVDTSNPEMSSIAAQLGNLVDRFDASERWDQSWRAATVLSHMHSRLNQIDVARSWAHRARQRLSAIVAEIPNNSRGPFLANRDAHTLSEIERRFAMDPSSPFHSDFHNTASTEPAYLRQLLALSRRLNAELRLQPLLEQIMDTAVELTGAERGFLLLLRDDDKAAPNRQPELEVVVARNFERDALLGVDARPSISIAERAARTGDEVLTLDALDDVDFENYSSVAALHLRSVVAVPLRKHGTIIGTIYVDHRLRRAAFDNAAVARLSELADIAAIAIHNARLLETVREHEREIATLNTALTAEVERKEDQLLQLNAELATGGREILRHAYDAIIGESRELVEVLRQVDRATDSELPVVVCGESGTGKELIARALHTNGPRASGPFVAVNCAAIAEPLLESELFGHARGAFTGADRDRRGVFELADGGTLFMDEVGEMSASMQSKLLRALQEREIRRVGDEKLRQIDIRIVAATNRDLGSMVSQKTFREDLYYRLNVIEVRLPPLRSRNADIPALARYLLQRHPGTTKRIARPAMAKLCAYHWPGNIRQLDNELARASALSSGKTITLQDLSPDIMNTRNPTADTEELDLRSRIEQLERNLIEQAMSKTNANQTAAAKLLGLSRYGLQKKLKRYNV